MSSIYFHSSKAHSLCRHLVHLPLNPYQLILQLTIPIAIPSIPFFASIKLLLVPTVLVIILLHYLQAVLGICDASVYPFLPLVACNNFLFRLFRWRRNQILDGSFEIGEVGLKLVDEVEGEGDKKDSEEKERIVRHII